jgi:AmiR/NasT family two-component response regulator
MLDSPGYPLGPGRKILVAGKRCRYRDELASALASLGNHVFAKHLRPAALAEGIARDEPDLVVVVAGPDRAAGLLLIGAARRLGRLPVVAATEGGDNEWTNAAVAAGASAAVIGLGREGLRATVHAVCERFAEFRKLEEAFERRAVIERAKGILMASQRIAGDDAFVLLRDHSRRTNRKLEEIADAVLNSHELLTRRPPVETRPSSGLPTGSAASERVGSSPQLRSQQKQPLVGHLGRR